VVTKTSMSFLLSITGLSRQYNIGRHSTITLCICILEMDIDIPRVVRSMQGSCRRRREASDICGVSQDCLVSCSCRGLLDGRRMGVMFLAVPPTYSILHP
jgi:hypothetical protein